MTYEILSTVAQGVYTSRAEIAKISEKISRRNSFRPIGLR